MRRTGWFARAAVLSVLLAVSGWASASVSTPSASGAEANSSNFESAVSAYRAGDLATAEVLFSGLLDEGLSSNDRAIVLGDLGNIAYRQDQLLAAVAYYTAATREKPRDADLWHNLELARSSAGLKPADAGDLASTALHLISLPKDSELWSGAWLLVGLMALGLLAEILRGGTLPKVGVGLVILALAGDLTLLQVRSMNVLEAPAMVVAEEGAELSSEPRTGANSSTTLGPSEIVEVVDRLGKKGQVGAWVKVKSAEGQGWLPDTAVLSW